MTVSIDVFEEKQIILKNLSNKELEYEINRRKENNIVKEKEDELHIDFNINPHMYKDDFLGSIDDVELITELESLGYHVLDDAPGRNNITKKELALSLGLRWWATKEQILNELEYVIN